LLFLLPFFWSRDVPFPLFFWFNKSTFTTNFSSLFLSVRLADHRFPFPALIFHADSTLFFQLFLAPSQCRPVTGSVPKDPFFVKFAFYCNLDLPPSALYCNVTSFGTFYDAPFFFPLVL